MTVFSLEVVHMIVKLLLFLVIAELDSGKTG